MSTKSAKISALLNRKRKVQDKEESTPSTSTASATPNETLTQPEITAKDRNTENAKKALIFEAKRAKERSEEYGPQGWLRPKSLSTNKQFLHRTLKSTLTREERDKLNGK